MLVQLKTTAVKVGMFVAEIDRPWLDTPFLLQGFLIEDEDQLGELRKHCELVSVDRERSRAGVLPDHVAEEPEESERSLLTLDRQAQAAPAPAPTRTGLFDRLLGAFGSRGEYASLGGDVEDDGPPPEIVHHDFIPHSVELKYHPRTRSFQDEVEPATQVFAQSSDFTRQIFSDIENGKPLAIDGLQDVMTGMVDSMLRNPDALMWVAHLKQEHSATYAHDLQVAVHLVAFGRNLNLPKPMLDQLCMLGLLLDIGKTRLPAELLAKPGRMTPEEFAWAKAHVKLGLDLLRETPNLHSDILEGIGQHHEREDGTGYPNALSSGSISLYGRMAGIVDTFVAMTNERPYAKAEPALDTLRKMTVMSQDLFHKPLVEQFIQSVGVFPVGSLVELSNGEVAVVIKQNKVRRLQPRVLVICGPDKVPSASFRVMELLYQADKDANRVYIARGLTAGAYGLDAHEYYLA
jgi:HD-GYP domain-containing protein (c-di-GMP phosphodiesterase class II)